MKQTLLSLLVLFNCLSVFAASRRGEVQVQPAFWWSGMEEQTLQVMLHGPGVGQSEVNVAAPGIAIDSIHRPANTNYLFIYLNLHGAAPQKFDIELRQGRRVQRVAYELRQRDHSVKAQGFDASDVLYLLMPDRFVNGNKDNDVVKGLREQTSGQEPDARHGGDLAGMTLALDYLADLGVTAVWPTPLQVNDMPSHSYHGYAITDYYQIDPRYGSNEDYRNFVRAAHEKGIKVVQDMVFNHCGSENFLFRDLPDSTWFNNRSVYRQTAYRIAAVGDSHAVEADADNAQNGWFVSVMPDLNQRNPHVLRYLIQNSLLLI